MFEVVNTHAWGLISYDDQPFALRHACARKAIFFGLTLVISQPHFLFNEVNENENFSGLYK